MDLTSTMVSLISSPQKIVKRANAVYDVTEPHLDLSFSTVFNGKGGLILVVPFLAFVKPGYTIARLCDISTTGISTTSISTKLFRSDMIEDVLVLVCKRPGLGKGKQRLAAGLGPDAANRIAEAMLACALEDARAWPGSVMIAPANRDDYSWAKNLLPEAGSKVRVQPQADGNLGQRLNTLGSHVAQCRA